MRILIDVDDVIIDLVTEWLRIFSEVTGHQVSKQVIKSWDILSYIPEGEGKAFMDILDRADLYDEAVQIPYAVHSIKQLIEDGAEVLFVTANTNPTQVKWLYRHGLPDNAHVVAANKSIIKGDVLIDDNMQNLINFPGEKILFSQPWNDGEDIGDGINPKSFHFANNWADVMAILEKIQASPVKDDLGLSPLAPTVVNANGGKQSELRYAFDLIDPLPMFTMANILYEGADKYGAWNWRRISVEENLNHALSHIFAHMAGDGTDDHLGHAFCRLHFALSMHLTPEHVDRMTPED